MEVPKLENIQEWHQPVFSDDEVERICWDCVFEPIKPSMVTRLIISTIYGGRKNELGRISSKNIHLDGDDSYIEMPVSKHGKPKRQPLPKSLVPLLSIPLEPVNPTTLHSKFIKVVEKAGISWRRGLGFHALRRNVVTLIDHTKQSDLNKHRFMRWSIPRQYSMLERYRQTTVEESDMAILKVHPRVEMWEQIIPYLLQFNPYYDDRYCNI